MSERNARHSYLLYAGSIPRYVKGVIFSPICDVQLADEIILISIISLIVIFARAPVLSNLIYTKHAQ